MTPRLADILEHKFGVAPEAYSDARRLALEKGVSVGEILVQRKVVSEHQLLEALSRQFGLPFWPNLPLENIGGAFVQRVPIQFLKKFLMVPLQNGEAAGDRGEPAGEAAGCTIAVWNPAVFQALEDLGRLLGVRDYRVVLAPRSAILAAINMAYDFSEGSAEQLVQDMTENGGTIISEIQDTADLLDDTSDAPIIKLVNHIITQSVKARASDIHIEPYQDSFKVRYRVDGILYDLLAPPKWIQPALISRIKVMARLNIAEKRLPQDGRLDVKVGNQEIDVRVSTLPTGFGERVVLRLLNKTSSVFKLSEIGLPPDRLATLDRPWSSRPTASSSSRAPPAAARPRPFTRCSPPSTTRTSTSSPSRTRWSTRSRGSARSRSTPRST
jgi:general secretion pathway protein E